MKITALLMALFFIFVSGCSEEPVKNKSADNVKNPPVAVQNKTDAIPPGMYKVGKDILANEYIIVKQQKIVQVILIVLFLMITLKIGHG